jgi:hypothetical protein
MSTQKPKPPDNADDPAQSQRFIDMAKEVEADETPGATERAFEKVIKDKPPNRVPPKTQAT